MNQKQTGNAERMRELTAAELDALIAEQSKPENQPAWWLAAERKQGRLKASRVQRDKDYEQRRKLRRRK